MAQSLQRLSECVMMAAETMAHFSASEKLGGKLPRGGGGRMKTINPIHRTAATSTLTMITRRRINTAISPNVPQQRPRATGVICKQGGIAGFAACGGLAMCGTVQSWESNLDVRIRTRPTGSAIPTVTHHLAISCVAAVRLINNLAPPAIASGRRWVDEY